MKKVGVVGFGLMGCGIAEVCAKAGYDVIASSSGGESVEKGLAAIKASLYRAVERGRATAEEKEDALSRIKGTMSFDDFRGCDLVIEAVPEDLELKKKIFAQLDKVCPPDAILATNTSCLSVIDIAVATRRPERVLGLHFFNPVPLMKLVELVKTVSTSDETVSLGNTFGQSLGKTVIVVRDLPGFIVIRLIMPFVLGAIRLYESGYASKEDIDQAIVMGLNHPMGPLALCDFAGLDTILSIADSMYKELRETQLNPPILLKKMVAAGHLGRKTGRGFYDYRK
ncbi:MAG: 3-hydroxybutyryl-CoA dehydrogenase [Chloroflexi bacterium]|nr:3-hydroxybutyryl-CoA dehydrogenase [Chloroflexota bacterium]